MFQRDCWNLSGVQLIANEVIMTPANWANWSPCPCAIFEISFHSLSIICKELYWSEALHFDEYSSCQIPGERSFVLCLWQDRSRWDNIRDLDTFWHCHCDALMCQSFWKIGQKREGIGDETCALIMVGFG